MAMRRPAGGPDPPQETSTATRSPSNAAPKPAMTSATVKGNRSLLGRMATPAAIASRITTTWSRDQAAEGRSSSTMVTQMGEARSARSGCGGTEQLHDGHPDGRSPVCEIRLRRDGAAPRWSPRWAKPGLRSRPKQQSFSCRSRGPRGRGCEATGCVRRCGLLCRVTSESSGCRPSGVVRAGTGGAFC